VLLFLSFLLQQPLEGGLQVFLTSMC
jgi:hypothetical protein